MRKDLISSLVAVVVLTLALGIAYPLVVTGIGQVVFADQADGSRVKRDGREVGSRLIGQAFVRETGEEDADGNPVTEPDERYFQSRPSVSGYNPAGTFFNNLGPNQADLRDLLAANADAYLALEGPDNPGLTRSEIPPDALTTSASSVDPHISPENARLQAARVARVRGLQRDRVRDLIDDNTAGRALGFMGEPGVNVLELNLALNREETP
jgi:potassium-transporting ATPase KdpC subunit